MQAQQLTTLSIADILGAEEASLRRTPGVHVTDLTMLQMRAIDPTWMTEEYDPKTRENWMHAGFLWERMISRVFQPSRVMRCGEIVLDKVIGSPDWLELATIGNDEYLVVGESKATWKSARGFDDPTPAAGLDDFRFLHWKMQIMAYCHMANVPHAIMHILFINSDYKAFIPEIRSYVLHFSQRELDENWQRLIGRGIKAGVLAA